MAEIRLNKSAFFHNLSLIAEHIGDVRKIAIVLKDNAYGHGLLEMAELSREFGIHTAVTRSCQEAIKIRHFFDETIVLNAFSNPHLPEKCTRVINDMRNIDQLSSGENVELKVDTGMHRNGIDPNDLADAFDKIHKQGLNLKGVMTHLRGGDDLSSDLFWQLQNFQSVKERSRELANRYDMESLRFHSSSSSATFRRSSVDDDLVRIGIAAYGYLEWDSVFGDPGLQPVLSLWADRIASRALPAQARIGYGGCGENPKAQCVSSYDIGYGDGFFRLNESSPPYCTPDGTVLFPRVSMDCVSAEGDAKQLCLFDDARGLANIFQTITYDVLAKLQPHIPRKII